MLKESVQLDYCVLRNLEDQRAEKAGKAIEYKL
jgi:hypothetical protein